MENFLTLLIVLAAGILFVRVLLAPIKVIWKILINAGCGFLCLWILNFVSSVTGILFPLNFISVTAAGFLGIPGIIILAVMQLL